MMRSVLQVVVLATLTGLLLPAVAQAQVQPPADQVQVVAPEAVPVAAPEAVPVAAPDPVTSTAVGDAPVSVEAAPSEAPVADDPKDKSRAMGVQGQALYDQGQFIQAAAAFEAAQVLFSHPSNLFNAAKAHEKAAEYDKAAASYQSYLELAQAQNNGTAANDAADVERTIEVLKEKAFLALPEVTIDSDPSGAEIYVDDPVKVLGSTPYATHLPAGTHKVFLKKKGHQGFEREFVVRSRDALRLAFAMEKIKNDGFVRVYTNIRKARIYVDGKVVAVSPFDDPLPVEAGTHQIVVEKEDYNQVSRTVEIRAGVVTDVKAELKLGRKSFSWRGGLGITSLILGGGSLGTGFWLRSMANKEWNTSSDYKTYKQWTYVGYGVGSGLLGIGLALLIWEGARKEVRPQDLVLMEKIPMPVAGPAPIGNGFMLGATARW